MTSLAQFYKINVINFTVPLLEKIELKCICQKKHNLKSSNQMTKIRKCSWGCIPRLGMLPSQRYPACYVLVQGEPMIMTPGSSCTGNVAQLDLIPQLCLLLCTYSVVGSAVAGNVDQIPLHLRLNLCHEPHWCLEKVGVGKNVCYHRWLMLLLHGLFYISTSHNVKYFNFTFINWENPNRILIWVNAQANLW